MRRAIWDRISDDYWWYGRVVPVVLCLWYTVIFGGAAYVYWFTGLVDPRDIFGGAISHLGAILMFPVGWFYLCWKTWTEF